MKRIAVLVLVLVACALPARADIAGVAAGLGHELNIKLVDGSNWATLYAADEQFVAAQTPPGFTGQVYESYGCITVKVKSNRDFGCGELKVTVDHALAKARITGSFNAVNGTLTANVTLTGTGSYAVEDFEESCNAFLCYRTGVKLTRNATGSGTLKSNRAGIVKGSGDNGDLSALLYVGALVNA